MKEINFKSGDIVKCINIQDVPGNVLKLNKIYEITKVGERGVVIKDITKIDRYITGIEFYNWRFKKYNYLIERFLKAIR